MQKMPSLDEYNINFLIILGNQTDDVFTRDQIKASIIDKILELKKPMFFLINKFIGSERILKEAYADTIMMGMKNNKYHIQENIVDEILKYASLNALMYYGADSSWLEFSEKCKKEFDNRAKLIEDKVELNKKKNMGKVRVRKILIKKGKVKKNDKY